MQFENEESEVSPEITPESKILTSYIFLGGVESRQKGIQPLRPPKYFHRQERRMGMCCCQKAIHECIK